MVLLRFANHASRPIHPRERYDTLFNAVGGDPLIAPGGRFLPPGPGS